jgi:Family of unknown function (DUF6491)
MRLSAASLALLLAAPGAAMAAPAATACLRQDMVNGWTVVSDRTLIVTDRVGKKFRMSFTAPCYDLKFQTRLAFRSPGGTGLTCLGHNDYVLVPPGGGMPAQRCFISDVQAYNPATPPKPAASK